MGGGQCLTLSMLINQELGENVSVQSDPINITSTLKVAFNERVVYGVNRLNTVSK